MKKLIIFDLDGVLVDLREVHYKALNDALNRFGLAVITQSAHELEFNGLTTRQKLALLGITGSQAEEIYIQKQKNTTKEVLKLKPDLRLKEVLKRLKEDGYILACASNSIRSTVKNALLKTGLLEYIDFYLSNEDVKKPKPSPEIFYHCLIITDLGINDIVIVEDGEYGKEAGLKTGANLIMVKSPEDITYEIFT